MSAMPNQSARWLTWFNPAQVAAGFIAVIVGYSSAAAIIFQAAQSAGATAEQISSWLWALGIGMAASSAALSLWYKMPILTAWSTPGAALLVAALSGLSMEQAVGSFLVSSLLLLVVGVTGSINRIIDWIPVPLAQAMLAGILLQFGVGVFVQTNLDVGLVAAMLVIYLVMRVVVPRYAIPSVLAVGALMCALRGQIQLTPGHDIMAWPVWTTPAFSWEVVIGVSVPLFLVTLTSQNVPGLATLRAHGYRPSARPLIGWTGATGVLMAPFGGFAYNLAAITAAICMNPDVESNPEKRYRTVLWASVAYLLAGVFAGGVVTVLTALPATFIAILAGLALFGVIGQSLYGAFAESHTREGALITFLITVSGVTLLGIGSAFWGIVVGLAAHALEHKLRNRNANA